MKNLFISLVLLSTSFCAVSAQENVDNSSAFSGVDGIVQRGHIANKKPIPYAYVREADVMWSKTIWRMIDLREKINLPMYYPTVALDGRSSLMNVLLKAIKNGELTPYQAGGDEEFAKRIEFEDVRRNLGGSAGDTTMVKNPETGLYEAKLFFSEARPEDVKKILLKEVWYFDKNYTRMDVRIIGMCPIFEAPSEDGSRVDQKQVCWLYFPEARYCLANQEVFNMKNDSKRLSYDDIFQHRMFGSYIYSESNVFNNRPIISYTAGMETTLESERIKNELFLKEHDVWEF